MDFTAIGVQVAPLQAWWQWQLQNQQAFGKRPAGGVMAGTDQGRPPSHVQI
jgi:hypothetical protein